MMQIVICKEPEELNGMRLIHCLPFGNFMNQADNRMDLTGRAGEQNKK